MVGIHEKAPFIRIAPPFIAGIALAIHQQIPLSFILPVSLGLFVLIITHRWTLGRNEIMLHRHRHGIVLHIFFFTFGMLAVALSSPALNKNHYSLQPPPPWLEVTVDAAPVEKEKSIKIEAVLNQGVDGGEKSRLAGRVIFYVAKDSLSQHLKYGDVLMVINSLKEISAPRNPFEFDYKEYLANHFIYRQGYLKTGDWLKVGFQPRFFLYNIFIPFRDKMLGVLRSLGVSGQEYAVISALVLGKTDEIDYHLMLAYSSSGAIHVLAVSGLHVGLLFVVISWMLSPIKKLKHGKFIASFLAALIIWFYAGLTGFSPSVLRATVMFTAMLVAGLSDKKQNIFNTLFFSAVGLLVWNPYYIMEVGFQLSYLAVLGIIILYRKIYSMINFPTWILDKLWGLTAISLAAQAVTFPLGMLYFHQFPNWFLVSNLFVIPISTLILYLTLLLFAVSWIAPVADVLAQVVIFLTRVMNKSVQLVEALPYSIWQGISITVVEAWLLYGIVIFASSWIYWKRPRHFIVTSVFILALLMSQAVETFHQVRHEEICFHNVRGGMGITYTTGKHSYFFHSGIDTQDESFVRFHLKNYWDKLGNEISKINLDSVTHYADARTSVHDNFVSLGATSVCVVDHFFNRKSLEGIPADVLLVMKSYSAKKEVTISQKTILIDDDVYPAKAKKHNEFFSQQGNKVFNLSNEALLIRNGKMVLQSAD
ncbi:MAG: ComEC/Rec2 family competence protein [Flavobacteriales bacterium]|mgnify:CR=1 FL=1|nr:ComEC/Rec2 family competence protein [Flavobacteriales bacterium]